MPLRKSDLYASLWKSCDELRGGMDASQYKDYVLLLLFVKYVSDKYAGKPHPMIEIPKGGGFADMVALKGKPDIGEEMNRIVQKLAAANESLQGVLRHESIADFNDETKLGKGKDMVDKLSNLVGIFDDPALDFGANQAGGDDLLGDAYEYLMRHFATESGKSKGQFYTPAEVSRIMARVIGLGAVNDANRTIYDPTCGSGSLLLKAHDEALSRTGHDLAVYGQEMDNSTASLAKMNMILHACETAEIWADNSLTRPHWKNDQDARALKPFDFIVANPPFSTKSWTNGLTEDYGRFAYGRPPEKNGDYAFLLHILTSLKSTGKAAVILPHGVLFRGNAEGAIREKIIRQKYLAGIIGLPANLFYGTGIPACLLLLDKENAAARTGIFMIDASKGFMKDGNKNRLREQDIHRIVDTYERRLDLPRYSRLVPFDEIQKNEFNLNLPRYIDASEPEDLHDLTAHLRGGIPARDLDALSAYWEKLPSVRAALFEDIPGRPGYLAPRVPAAEVKSAILSHPEFQKLRTDLDTRFAAWKTAAEPKLRAITPDLAPKLFSEQLAEDLLRRFTGAPLLDPYEVYQRFMDYRATTLLDDLHLVAAEGWEKAALPRPVAEDSVKDKKTGKEKKVAREEPDFVVDGCKLKADLIPRALLEKKHFAAERAEIEKLETARADAERALEAFSEEHAGDDSLLADALTDDGALTAKSVKDRLKLLKGDRAAREERDLLERALALFDAETDAAKAVKTAEKALELRLLDRYGELTEPEIQDLLVRDKWFAALDTALHAELDRVSQQLTGRIRTLTERYAAPLPTLEQSVVDLAARVAAHLAKMGVSV